MKNVLRILLLLAMGILAYAVYNFFSKESTSPGELQTANIEDFYPDKQDALVSHTAIHLSYNEETEQANWVVYYLRAEELKDPATERKNRFKADPKVQTESAHPNDYKKSGYDRGHLAPAADMLNEEKIMLESFYMSNMSPQHPSFNRGDWRKLENRVREWALLHDELVVVTGPHFDEPIEQRIGENQVAVPSHYFKAVLDISAQDGYNAIAFLMPNEKFDEELQTFAMSVDELEAETGYDFFASQPKALIDELEKQYDASAWPFD